MKSNQYIKIIVWSIVWCSIHSKIMLEFVSQQKFWKWANTRFYVVPVLQPYGFIQICFGFFVFVLSNKYYLSKLMLLDFRCQKISFLCKHNFCIDEKHTQWHWGTKVKVFHESILWFMKCPWNCNSRNTLKEKFHSVSFPLQIQ